MTLASEQHEEDPVLVLIANDQEWTARAIESILVANGYLVQRVFTAAEAMERIRLVRPDILILDQQLPDFSGVEICRRVRRDAAFGASLPIIITTAGPSGRQLRLSAYEAGAWDFFGQPLDAETILNKLRVYSAVSRQVRHLREAVLVDESSGLYSRSGLERRSTELLSEARRAGRALASIVWNIEGADPGTLGKRVGALLRSQGRSADIFGRIGETRFVAIAPGTGAVGASRFADRIRAALTELADAEGALVDSRVMLLDDQEQLPEAGSELLDRLERVAA